MNNILITGFTGFIGSNLTKSLRENNLTGISLREGNSINKNINWPDLENINTIDCIIHLAGKAHDLKKTTSNQEYFDINVGLTKQIFELFLKSSASKFIFFSSVKAVADKVTGAFLTEDSVSNPQTPYGKSKLEAEKYILEQPLPPGKQIYILRPCMVHGPGNKGNLNLLHQVVSKYIPWPLGSFENKRSFCSIDNLCFIIKELVDRNDIPSGIYNIADDDPISTNELIKLISVSQNRRSLILHLPKKLIKWVAKLGDLCKLPLNSERLQKLTENYIVSNDKIKKAIGKPLPVNARDGLLKTFQSFNNSPIVISKVLEIPKKGEKLMGKDSKGTLTIIPH